MEPSFSHILKGLLDRPLMNSGPRSFLILGAFFNCLDIECCPTHGHSSATLFRKELVGGSPRPPPPGTLKLAVEEVGENALIIWRNRIVRPKQVNEGLFHERLTK